MATLLRAYRVALDPTAEQRRALGRTAAAARRAHNWALQEWRTWRWANVMAAAFGGEAGKGPNAYALHARLTRAKKREPELTWLGDVWSVAVREGVADVGDGFSHFFRRLKKHRAGDHSECGDGPRCELGEPRFRSARQEPRWHGDQTNSFAVSRDAIRLPRIGEVRIARGQRGAIPESARLIAVGLSRRAGTWYAAVRAEVEAAAPGTPGAERPRVGVEVGVRVLAALSNGKTFRAVREHEGLKQAQRAKARWQRRLARRARLDAAGRLRPLREQSRGWFEARERVRHYEARIAEIRRDTLHQASHRIVGDGSQTLIVRESDVKGMLARGAKLTDEERRTRNRVAPLLAEMGGMYELRRQVEYKQAWRGGFGDRVEMTEGGKERRVSAVDQALAAGALVRVPSDYPSSRTCSVCGAVRDTDPGYPLFRCPSCGHVEDRELNSAKVLRDYAPSK